jgi:small subunit ribosomal protein S2e
VPCTKLGRLVKEGTIQSLEEICLFSLNITEHQIIDQFINEDTLKDEVMSITPVQKQTRAGQRTRFKAFVIVGDSAGHVGLGVKCAAEVASAIRGAIILAKLSVIPIRLGYWGSKMGKPHTIPCKVTGKCGSVRFRCIPAPRGTGIVAARAPKKLLQYAGLTDVYTASTGCTRTLGNFIKATYNAVLATSSFLTPNLWGQTSHSQSSPMRGTFFRFCSRLFVCMFVCLFSVSARSSASSTLSGSHSCCCCCFAALLRALLPRHLHA